MSEFVRMLIGGSEKAANIARIIRSEKELFDLLVEEKPEIQKNDRFVQDFKTLSDVLIQECLRHDIAAVFPMMETNIFGEECNTFTNVLGERITIVVKETVEETAQLLARVLNGNLHAAQILAEEVHRDVQLEGNETLSYLSNDFIDNYDDVGIWIDPIDATNEYIRGSHDDKAADAHVDEEVISTSGLRCVTVLIGAFNLTSGTPIVGVINQPFWKFDPTSKKWQGRTFWGVSANDQLVSSLTRYPLNRQQNNSKKVIIFSSSEDERLKNVLKDDFHFVSSSGAGYKLLCVALGLADLYILSRPTTHFWDTCGPHAIIKSLGGNIIRYENILEGQSLPLTETQKQTAQQLEQEEEQQKQERESAKSKSNNGESEHASNSSSCNNDNDVEKERLTNGNVINGSLPPSSSSSSSCGCSSSNSKNNNNISPRLRKLSTFSEVTYSVNNPCDRDANFANRAGIFAFRESSAANLAIDCIRRHLNMNHNHSS